MTATVNAFKLGYDNVVDRLQAITGLKVFDEMLDIKEIVDCAKDISKYYDNVINNDKTLLQAKKDLWLCLTVHPARELRLINLCDSAQIGHTVTRCLDLVLDVLNGLL